MKSINISVNKFLSTLLFSVLFFLQAGAQQKSVEWQYIDHTVKPGDDFFQFANGKWLDTVVFPSNRSYMGVNQESKDRLDNALLSIIRSAAGKQNVKGSKEQWLGDFYRSGMDTVTIEKRGLTPLNPFLQRIENIHSPKDVISFEGFMNGYNAFYLFSPFVFSDIKNNKKEVLNLYEKGMGLPKDYYLKDDEELQPLKQAYIEYLATMLALTGDKNNNLNRAWAVFNLEKQLATTHHSDDEDRNFEAHYYKTSTHDFDKKLQHFSLRNYANALGAKTDTVVLNNQTYFFRLDSLLTGVPIKVWRDYYKSRVVASYSSALNSEFRQANLKYRQLSRGVKTELPREKTVVNMLSSQLGETIGQLYVQKHFSPSTKDKVLDMVNIFKTAFENRLKENTWMDDATKLKAIDKVRAFKAKIGYPDQWKNIGGFTIDAEKYFENIIACSQANMRFKLSRIDKPVNNNLWIMNPQDFNAYVDMLQNGIVFSAGILQPPLFDPAAEDAVNYGGAGGAIGHEMSHNFDDMGVKFDKDGNLSNWWSEGDYSRFQEKSDELIKLYNGFTVLDSLKVNGTLSVGENIGDLGGLAIAYSAFMLAQQKNPSLVINGFTPEQRFFIAYAQSWRLKSTPEAVKMRLNADNHSPVEYRVIGPLMNFDPFYKAFNVQPGDKMYLEPEKRIRIW